MADHSASWTGYLTRLDFAFQAECDNPYLDIDGIAVIDRPNQESEQIALFWSGRQSFAGHYRPAHLGHHVYTATLRDRITGFRAEYVGAFEVTPEQLNAPFPDAPVSKGDGGRYLQSRNGSPFLWLADTWWYGASRRCGWPEPFQTLVRDRAEKGFSVIQLVVGTPPEIPAEHADAQNEGGYPFVRRWDLINPAYFDFVDRRIEFLVAQNLVPCILGGWGFHLEWMGQELMARYWRYLVARYGAYPVVWCLAGESDLHDNSRHAHGPDRPSAARLQRLAAHLPPGLRRPLRALKNSLASATPAADATPRPDRSAGWRAVGDRVWQEDGGRHPISIHPIVGRYSHEALGNPPWLGFTGVQSGHAEKRRAAIGALILAARTLRPDLPVINLEPWYDGIIGQFHAPDQRYAFWISMLAGAAGHTYGAHGLWNMGGSDNFMAHWGASDWNTAYRLPGATQLGLARQFLQRFEWWKLQPQPELLTDGWHEERPNQPLAAWIPGEAYFIYYPIGRADADYTLRQPLTIERPVGLWYDPRTGVELPASAIDRERTLPPPPDSQDWMLVLTPVRGEGNSVAPAITEMIGQTLPKTL